MRIQELSGGKIREKIAATASDLVEKFRKRKFRLFSGDQKGPEVSKESGLLSRRNILRGLGVGAVAVGGVGVYALNEEEEGKGKEAHEELNEKPTELVASYVEVFERPYQLNYIPPETMEPIHAHSISIPVEARPFKYEVASEKRNQEFHNENREAMRIKLEKQFPDGNFPYTVDVKEFLPPPSATAPDKCLKRTVYNALRPIETQEGAVPLIDFVKQSAKEVLESQLFKGTSLYAQLSAADSPSLDHFLNMATQGIISQESSWINTSESDKEAKGLWQVQRGYFEDVVAEYKLGEITFEDVLSDSELEKYDPKNIKKQAEIIMLGFDMFYRRLKDYLPNHHWIFEEKDPKNVLIPLLINAHNAGPKRIACMIKHFDATYEESDIPAKFGVRGHYKSDLFLLMCTNYYGSNAEKASGYREDAIQYTPKAQAWNYLIEREMSRGEIKRRHYEYPLVDSRFVDAIEHELTISTIEKPTVAENILRDVKLKIDPNYQDNLGRTNLNVHTFLESHAKNPSNSQLAVTEWLDANDAFASRYRRGLETDADLKTEIERLEAGRNPKIRNLAENPHLTAYVNPRGSGVEESWRRVIRVDHIPVMDELNLRLNELLRERGMSEDYFITAMINSTVRSQEKNRAVRGSFESAHLSFSAVDINDKNYLVQKFEADGTITRYRDDQNLKKFLDALRIVAYEMALEGKIKVRFHDGHFHIVPMVRTEAED